MEHEGALIPIAWNNPQRFGKGAGRVENQSTSQDHPNYSILKMNQNTDKNSRDLRRLAVTQTPMKELAQSNMVIIILDMAKKGKPQERNWVSSNSSIKQCHKD